MTVNSIFTRLSSNYFSFFIYLGIISPFWAIWLKSKGLSASEIGIIIALPHIMKIFIAPLVSQAADHAQEYWRPLFICTCLTVILSTFYFVADGFWMILLISVAVNIFLPALMPLLETITTRQTVKHQLNYGRIRSFGSLSFILAAIFFGWVLKNNSIDTVLWGTYGSLIFILITVIFLPRGNNKIIKKVNDTHFPLKKLLLNGNFILFLLNVGFLQMSHGVYYAMGSIYWKEGGIEEDIIGLLWAVGVIAEIIIFIFFGKYFSKITPRYIFAFIGVFGAIRWAVMAMTLSVPVLFFIQILHGLTFGASHLGAIYYLSSRIPEQYAGSAQSLYTALPLGLGMGLSTYFGSVLYENIGGDAYYAMSILCIMTIFVSLKRQTVAKIEK